MGRVTRTRPPGKLGELAKIRAEGKRAVFKVLPLIKEQALRESGPDPDRDPFVIHPSEMAKADWCVRSTFYRISGKPDPDRKFNFVLENIFAEGHGIHGKFQSWLRGTGKLFGLWVCQSCGMEWTGISGELPSWPGCVSCLCSADNVLCSHEDDRAHVWDYREVRLRVPGCSIVGRADGALEDSLVECKSVGLGTLRMEARTTLNKYYLKDVGLYDLDKLWKELSRPFPSHIKQAVIYLWLAREMGLPYKRMTFIYEFKPNQQVKEFSITLSDDIINPLLEMARKVDDALKYNRPPACSNDAEKGCDQCKAYEGESSEGSKAPAEESDGKTRRVVTRRAAGASEAGSGECAPAARRRASRASRGADRAARPRADDAHEPVQPVEHAPGLPTQRGPGRRAVRGAARGAAHSAGADPQ